jgi:hypothetical protein
MENHSPLAGLRQTSRAQSVEGYSRRALAAMGAKLPLAWTQIADAGLSRGASPYRCVDRASRLRTALSTRATRHPAPLKAPCIESLCGSSMCGRAGRFSLAKDQRQVFGERNSSGAIVGRASLKCLSALGVCRQIVIRVSNPARMAKYSKRLTSSKSMSLTLRRTCSFG